MAALKFFWGGNAARAVGKGSKATSLIQMGVWCDSSQPRLEETGVIQQLRTGKRFKSVATKVAMDCCAHLTPAG
jgi:hypothetical protein